MCEVMEFYSLYLSLGKKYFKEKNYTSVTPSSSKSEVFFL